MNSRRAVRAAACGLVLLTACRSPAAAPGSAPAQLVNPVLEAGLRGAVSVEILELVETQAGPQYEVRLTLSQPQQVDALIEALDAELPLGPAARCIERYRLRFHLSSAATEEFAYSCEDGQAFLGGSQPFWSFQQVTPPERFRGLMLELLGP